MWQVWLLEISWAAVNERSMAQAGPRGSFKRPQTFSMTHSRLWRQVSLVEKGPVSLNHP